MSADLIGKYLRLRRELLEPGQPAQTSESHRRRVARELLRIGAELQMEEPEKMPFLDTMPWSDTLG